MNYRYAVMILASTLCAVPSAQAQYPLIIDRCSGEPMESVQPDHVKKDTVLYAEPRQDSKPVGTLKKGQKAREAACVTVITKPGRGRVTAVLNPESPVKVGDDIEFLLDAGEGYWLIQHNGKRESIVLEDIKWKGSAGPESESWQKISADGLEGYTDEWPLEIK